MRAMLEWLATVGLLRFHLPNVRLSTNPPHPPAVIPAKAGIQFPCRIPNWTPAFAGVTLSVWMRRPNSRRPLPLEGEGQGGGAAVVARRERGERAEPPPLIPPLKGEGDDCKFVVNPSAGLSPLVRWVTKPGPQRLKFPCRIPNWTPAFAGVTPSVWMRRPNSRRPLPLEGEGQGGGAAVAARRERVEAPEPPPLIPPLKGEGDDCKFVVNPSAGLTPHCGGGSPNQALNASSFIPHPQTGPQLSPG
ncbi:hypothetical protein SAMN02745223_03267 [Devosia limi DSM 17137]|uniref:Uncharacterized protein n=1 Tax=Devosia limi DSM 17137 TaxID=1121477 RepID=A0A1M5DJH4_9HYPH|nr:hypothetical protein SAMN02745223_03267 [Devosia limi DSM 17137]